MKNALWSIWFTFLGIFGVCATQYALEQRTDPTGWVTAAFAFYLTVVIASVAVALFAYDKKL